VCVCVEGGACVFVCVRVCVNHGRIYFCYDVFDTMYAYCSVLQCVAVCCSVLQYWTGCIRHDVCMLQFVAVCCSVLQRVAVLDTMY